MPDFPASATPAGVWTYVTRELTDKTGFEISGVKTTLDDLNDITAADVWAVAARELTAFTGDPRTDLLGEDADFEAGTGARKVRIDNIPAFETQVETPIIMDGNELVLVEKTDSLMSLLDGFVDLTTMAGGDTILIRQYMKVKAGGNYIKYAEETYSGAQAIPLLNVITKTSKTAIKVTAQQTAGVNRTLDVQFFRRPTA
jgi:hypothetical protein